MVVQQCIAAVCRDPVPPLHGSITHYTSTVEGASLTFKCDEGYSPTEEMTTTCNANGDWEPNPVDTNCVKRESKNESVWPMYMLCAKLLYFTNLYLLYPLLNDGYRMYIINPQFVGSYRESTFYHLYLFPAGNNYY